MRKRIKVTGFSDWDTMFYNNLLSIPVLAFFSIVAENWGSENLHRNLYVSLLSHCRVCCESKSNTVAPRKHGTSCYLLLHSRVRQLSASHTLRHGVSARRAAQLTGQLPLHSVLDVNLMVAL